MSRASIPELNADGCNVHFFEVLSQDGVDRSSGAAGLSVRIPSTVYFDSGVPRMWFFNASDGVVRKRDAKAFTADDIWTSFTKLSTSSSIDDLVAVILSVPPPSYEAPASTLHGGRGNGVGGGISDPSSPPSSSDTTTQYLDTRGLRTLLFGGSTLAKRYPRRFVLQHFEQPQGWYNASIRATWTPKVSLVEALRSPCSLRDVWKDENERGATFESPSAIRTSLPSMAHDAVKWLCGQVAHHMEAVCDAEVTGMLLYFKCNAKREMLLLYPGSLRLRRRQQASPSQPKPTLHVSPKRAAAGSVGALSRPAKQRLHPVAATDAERPLNIWHSMCSAAQLAQKRNLEVLFTGKSVDNDLCALEKRLASISPHGNMGKRQTSVSPALKRGHRVPHNDALLPRTEALYVATARQLGIPIPACLSILGTGGSPHRSSGLTSWLTSSPSPTLLRSEQKSPSFASPPNPWQQRHSYVGVSSDAQRRLSPHAKSRQPPSNRVLAPLPSKVAVPYSSVAVPADIAPPQHTLPSPTKKLLDDAGRTSMDAMKNDDTTNHSTTGVPQRRRSVPVVLSPITHALAQAQEIVFPVPYMREDHPSTGCTSPPTVAMRAASRDMGPAPLSPGSAHSATFSDDVRALSPTGRQRRCNDACVALDDLLYMIQSTMPQRGAQRHGGMFSSPDPAPAALFEYNADVLPPHLVARVLSPLGAQLVHNGGDAPSSGVATVAVLPAHAHQPSELFKAVQLCQQNIKQLQRKGWQTPPPSAPQVMQSVPQQLEFLWERRATPASISVLDDDAPPPHQSGIVSTVHINGTHDDDASNLCGDPPPLPVLTDL